MQHTWEVVLQEEIWTAWQAKLYVYHLKDKGNNENELPDRMICFQKSMKYGSNN